MARFLTLLIICSCADVSVAGSCCGPCCPLPIRSRPVPGVVRVTNAVGSATQTVGSDTQTVGSATQTIGSATHLGTGTVVARFAKRDVVLTCNHLFSEGVGRITVFVPGGRAFGANLLRRDPAADLAAIEISPSGIEVVEHVASNPRPGETLVACGFGHGAFRARRGTVLHYLGGEGGTPTFALSGAARTGDSGGPILDERGRIVGVLWGTDGRVTVATSASAVEAFLRPTLDALAAKEANSGKLVPVRPKLPKTAPERKPEITPETPVDAETETNSPPSIADRDRSSDIPSMPREAWKPPTVSGSPAASPFWTLLAWTSVLLGGTSPISLVLLYYLKFRRLRAAAKALAPTVTQYGPLNDRYASQLTDLYALSGRSPTADATLGREYDRELENAETGSDPTIAKWAKQLRRRVASQFYRIHDDAPVPAEPV